MIYAITGHTKGIGKELYQRLINDGHDVIGFSKSNGYDICKNYLGIISKTKNCDVFINNAYDDQGQTILFNMLYELWSQDSTKTIVNILSRSRFTEYLGTNSKYGHDKQTLYKTAMSRVFDETKKCRIINISPGMTDTDFNFSNELTNNKLDVKELVDTILYTIYLPVNIEIADLCIWKIPRIKEI